MLRINHKQTLILATAAMLAACNKQPVGPVGPDPYNENNYTTLSYVRSLYNGGDAAPPPNTKLIRATVVSNYRNEAAGNFRIQDASGRGINMFLGTSWTDTNLLHLGNTVDININNSIVGAFNGDLQIRNLQASAFTRIQPAVAATPRAATVRQVLDSLQQWSSTVVTIENVTVTATGTTGSNFNITDATGTIVTFVRTTSGITVTPGNYQSVTGYVSIFQSNPTFSPTPQIILRTQSDLVQGGPGANGNGMVLTTSPLTIDFDNISNGVLPAGVSVRTDARANNLGNFASFNNNRSTSLWANFTAGFRNYASASGLTASTDSATQVGRTNRALGIRQTGTIPSGGDPGAAFVFLLANTQGKNNLKMDFQLQSLDSASGRTTTWAVDYALGDNPATFTPVTTITGNLTTGNSAFSNNAISVTLPAALSNQSQRVWVRIITLTASTGGGSRASSAIDDVKFTWN